MAASVESSSISCIPIATFDPATLTGSFQALNGTGFADDIKIMEIYNGGTVGIDISFDGVTTHLFWPSKATLVIDFQANHADNSAYGSGIKYAKKGQIIYGKTSTSSLLLNMSGFR